jgi:hypothetical protein
MDKHIPTKPLALKRCKMIADIDEWSVRHKAKFVTEPPR